MDLTKFYGPDGLVLDSNFLIRGAGKTTDDMLKEMQSTGLRVDYLITSGELIRCPVTAKSNVRGDKGLEKSGWYVINEHQNNYYAAWGNWRTGEDYKFSTVDISSLPTASRQALQAQINEAIENSKKERKKRYQEVADEVKDRFKLAKEVQEHRYLKEKEIINYGLKELNNNLLIPIYSVDNELRSLQRITPRGDKFFVSASEVKGNIFLIGCDFGSLPNLRELIVVEGYATGATVYETTNKPVACVFSANFGFDAVTNLRNKTNAKMILAFDNDKSGLGYKKAQEISNAIYNCVVRVPSIIGDFNDLAKEQGKEQVKLELEDKGLGIKSFSVRNFGDEPPEREWLVENLLEKSKTVLCASIGGLGKSLLFLDLALKVSFGNGMWLNKRITKGGNVVILSAEDDRSEVHRRVATLDPLNQRATAPYDVFALSIPDTSNPLILLKEDNQGLNITAAANELISELESIKNLELVIIDPVQSFVTAPITTSQEAGQLYCQFCASIASKFNCVVVSLHHMSKTALTSQDDAMSVRASIRGASSLVDGMRMAIALWLCPEQEAENICFDYGVEFDRTRVVRSAVVKTNSSEVDTKTLTLFRRKAVLEPLENGNITIER